MTIYRRSITCVALSGHCGHSEDAIEELMWKTQMAGEQQRTVLIVNESTELNTRTLGSQKMFDLSIIN